MKDQRQQGFTIIELLLALTLFGSVLLSSTVILLKCFDIYNKGITLKQTNQVLRTVTEDISRLANSGGGVNYEAQTRKFTDRNGVTEEINYAGCLKVGASLYLWNVGHGDDNNSDYGEIPFNGYKTKSESSKGKGNKPYYLYDKEKPINFVKIDASNDCSSISSPENLNSIFSGKISSIIGDQARVYIAKINKLSGSQDLYDFNMSIGTFRPGSENPIPIGEKLTCTDKNGQIYALANFCSFSNYKTIIYTPNRGNNE